MLERRPEESSRGRALPSWARRLLGSPLLEAMTAPHGVSRYLEAIDPAWSLDEDRAQVLDIRRETEDAVTLVLRPLSAPVPFRAGQFVPLTVEVDGVRRTRCYSLSCSEHRGDGLLEVTVRRHPRGVVSGYLNDRARPGLVVGLGQAQGEFTLPSPRPPRLLLISGGSGITPVMSILRTLCDEGWGGRATFLHYARSPRDVIFGAELEDLASRHPNVDLVPVYTRAAPDPRSRGLRGHFTPEHLEAADPGHRGAETYVCGPPALVAAVREAREAEGLSERLRVEQFEPSPPSHAGTSGRVRFEASGVATEGDGRTLLELAEAAGLSPEHGCRMGVCHRCTRRLTGGRARHVRTGEVCAEPGTEIQLCVNAPDGDVAIDL
ncbi:MAG: ferredoxin reductase [Myxococcota bacterium]